MYIKCNDSKFLTFYEGDFFHIKQVSGATAFQPCEEKEERKIYTDLLYVIGRKEIKKSIYIKFDFEKSTFEVNGIKYKVVEDFEYTYKKTRGNNLKAINGLKGFYTHVLCSMNANSAFYIYTYSLIEKLGKINQK